MQDLTSLLPPMAYKPHLHRRSESRPDARAILRRAIRRHCAIEITRDVDFIHLFHVLDRMPEKHQYTLVRQRAERECWLVFLRPREPVSSQN